MPKRAVRILVCGTVVSYALVGAALAAQQNPENAKVASQTAAPSTKTAQSNATPAKFVPMNRDVCAKHPNLKQCS